MAELLLGYGASSLFNYNRESFKYDQDQLIQRESFRFSMQIRRFKLFREDVRDLVALTVDRMDIYHLVGALVLQFCVILFCEGRVQQAAPPFLLSLFLMSVGSAFVYLLLAVWLSMHASIAAHSFGVRILTRFVRLPIPSLREIEGLRFNLKDFEKQNITNMVRVPFLNTQDWDQVNPAAKAPSVPEGSRGSAAASSSGPAQVLQQPKGGSKEAASRRMRGFGLKSKKKYSSLADESPAAPREDSDDEIDAGQGPLHWSEAMPAPILQDSSLLPEEMDNVDVPIGGEDLLSSKQGAKPERHIQLFRHLQSKWQCYDAYCRVCMSLGLNQVLQGLSYYVICHTQVENHSPSTGYALIVMFQCTTVGLAILDLSGLAVVEVVLVQVVGILPCLFTAWGIAHRKHKGGGVLDPTEAYPLSPLSFLCQVLWLELWIRIAEPSDDEAKLPRRFRQTLFLDVFGDARGWDPEASCEVEEDWHFDEDGQVDDGGVQQLRGAAAKAASAYRLAQFALRRWQAAPSGGQSRAMRQEMARVSDKLSTWFGMLRTEFDRDANLRGYALAAELQPIRGLSAADLSVDPFAGTLIGPFEHDGGNGDMLSYYYDVEKETMIWEDGATTTGKNGLLLSLDSLFQQAEELEREARALLEARIMRDLRQATQPPVQESAGGHLDQFADTVARTIPDKCCSIARTTPGSGTDGIRETAFLSNLVGLFRKKKKARSPKRPGIEQRREVAGGDDLGNDGTTPAVNRQNVGLSGYSTSSARRPTLKDPTLRAMAGKHAIHFVPERLPWMIACRMSRVLQIAWSFSGLMTFLKEIGVYQIDFQQHPERRLEGWEDESTEPDALFLERVGVEWATISQPRAVHCPLPGAVLLATHFMLFSGPEEKTWNWTERANESLLWPSGTARFYPWSRIRVQVTQASSMSAPGEGALDAVFAQAAAGSSKTREPPVVRQLQVDAVSCAPSRGASAPECLAVSASRDSSGVHVWDIRDTKSWDLSDRAVRLSGTAKWGRVASATVLCHELPQALGGAASVGAADGSDWCAVVAGFDGSSIPIAVMRLPHGPGRPPAPDKVPGNRGTLHSDHPAASMQLVAEAPFNKRVFETGIKTLSLSRDGSRLWALQTNGDVLGWDFSGARRLGRWRPRDGAMQQRLQALSLCDYGQGELLMLGGGEDTAHPPRLYVARDLTRSAL